MRGLFTGNHESKLKALYRNDVVRHRHGYEVDPSKMDALEAHGLYFVARDETEERTEAFEVQGSKYRVGTQYHPDHLSRVLEPSQPILGLVAAASGILEEILEAPPDLAAEFQEASIK